MTHHILKATKETVHLGSFSHSLKPALFVDSHDTIDVETYTGYYIYEQAPPEFLQYLSQKKSIKRGLM